MIERDIERAVQKELPKTQNNDQLALTLQTIELMKEKGIWKKPTYPVPPLNTIGECNSNSCYQQGMFK